VLMNMAKQYAVMESVMMRTVPHAQLTAVTAQLNVFMMQIRRHATVA